MNMLDIFSLSDRCKYFQEKLNIQNKGDLEAMG